MASLAAVSEIFSQHLSQVLLGQGGRCNNSPRCALHCITLTTQSGHALLCTWRRTVGQKVLTQIFSERGSFASSAPACDDVHLQAVKYHIAQDQKLRDASLLRSHVSISREAHQSCNPKRTLERGQSGRLLQILTFTCYLRHCNFSRTLLSIHNICVDRRNAL